MTEGASALRDNDPLFRALLESAPDAMMLVNAAGSIVLVNSQLEKMFGYGRAELIGQAIEMLLPARIRALHPAHRAAYHANPRVRELGAGLDLYALHRSGKEFQVEIALSPLEVGGEAMVIASIRDVTERKRIEAALREQAVELELVRRTAQRASDLEREIVERSRAEAAVTAERDRAQLYLDTADVILLALNLEGRVTLINRHGCDVLGWTADELMGRDFIEACVPAYVRDATRAKLTQVHAGDDRVVANPVITRGGEERLIEWRTTYLRDAGGMVTATLSSGVDITERTALEAAHRASEERYRALFEYAPDGILIADRESYYLDANPAMCRMLGYTRDEFVGLHASDIVAPAETRHITPALEAITGSGDYRREWRFRRKDGSQFTASVIATVMPDGNLVAVIHDLTDRIAADEAVRHAEERMRYALDGANVGIWDMDYVTGVLRWSETLERQYELEPGTFPGTFDAFAALIHPDDRQQVLSTIADAVASRGDFRVRHRARLADGTIRSFEGTGQFLFDKDGKLTRAIGLSMDVTDRLTLEAQFQQAQKMEAVGRLAGGIAHDFNNLLTVILGSCELLGTELDPADPRGDDVREIQKAATSAAALTRQLLAFSRKEIISRTVLDVNAVVTRIRGMLERLIGEDIEIILMLQPDLGQVVADASQVEQVILNLAVNARDAMPQGGRLTIETRDAYLDEMYAEAHPGIVAGHFVMLAVTDTGVGMTGEVKARLFEPFFTTKEVGKGTGLGLATVYGIVHRSGGTVNVYSELGTGTSLSVYLPRADAHSIEATPHAIRGSRAGAGESVLVVEDADSLRTLTRRMLERLGYAVDVAPDAAAARQLFATRPGFDVLLTDVVMPGQSGPELAAELQQLNPMLRVVFMSGYTEDTIVQLGVLKPGIAFLHKPFSSDTLSRVLREILERDTGVE